jgi:hypothetical protein
VTPPTAVDPGAGHQPPDHLPCPTSRDFSVVDQDQSDNLPTTYRAIGGRMAQLTPTTADQGSPLTNGSDEGLVARFIAPALGCVPAPRDGAAPGTDDGTARHRMPHSQ